LADEPLEERSPAHGAPAGIDPDPGRSGLTGTENQIQWASQIRPRVALEFDRVARALQARALGQTEPDRQETCDLIAVVEEKRDEVLANDRAGYFIRDWQELNGRVREIIASDPRYRAIKAGREARRQDTPERT